MRRKRARGQQGRGLADLLFPDRASVSRTGIGGFACYDASTGDMAAKSITSWNGALHALVFLFNSLRTANRARHSIVLEMRRGVQRSRFGSYGGHTIPEPAAHPFLHPRTSSPPAGRHHERGGRRPATTRAAGRCARQAKERQPAMAQSVATGWRNVRHPPYHQVGSDRELAVPCAGAAQRCVSGSRPLRYSESAFIATRRVLRLTFQGCPCGS